MKSNNMQNIWVKRPSYWGENSFTELLSQSILDKEGQDNSRADLQNKSGFLKYNYSLLGNTVE